MKGSIRWRSKNSWELNIDLGHDSQGKRLRRFVNVKGKKADADKRLRALLVSLDKGLPINTEGVTVAEWLDRWLNEHIRPNKRQRTLERYRDVVRLHLKPHIGQMPLTKLSPTDIKTLEAVWSDQGMSATGVKFAHGILSTALNYGVKMEVLYRNPAQVVGPPRVEKREMQPPYVGTVNGILSDSEEKGGRLFPALRLIAYSGIRRGECLGLHWQRVDFTKQEITMSARW